MLNMCEIQVEVQKISSLYHLSKICEKDIKDGGSHEQNQKQSLCSSNDYTWYRNITILSRGVKLSLHIQPK